MQRERALRLLRAFRTLSKTPIGNHFGGRGYYVDSADVEADMIRKYVTYQEQRQVQMGLERWIKIE